MLFELFARLPTEAKPLLHSGQGWQYQMNEYQRMLQENHITPSMSRKGNCLDNSAMESFFGRLKAEMFHGEKFSSTLELERKLSEYIHYFNHKRGSVK